MDKAQRATVKVTNVNAVAVKDGVLVEFEYVAEAEGVGGEWGAAEKLIPWPLSVDKGDLDTGE